MHIRNKRSGAGFGLPGVSSLLGSGGSGNVNVRSTTASIPSKSEGDQEFELPINYLEDELWNIIRLNPDKLPQGKIQLIPSTAFTRLKHIELKSYEASASLKSNGDNYLYHISYPQLNRELEILGVDM